MSVEFASPGSDASATSADPSGVSCCSTAKQSSCCDTREKATCCGADAAAGGGCGCQ